MARHGVPATIHRARNIVRAGLRAVDVEKENKSLKKRNAQLESQLENAKAVKVAKNKEAHDLRRDYKRLEQRFDTQVDKSLAQVEFYTSLEHQRESCREYVIAQMHEPCESGKQIRYKAQFKHNFAHFAQKCASLRQAKGAGEALLHAIGLPDIKMPARSTTTLFKIIEGEAECREWLKHITLFGINCDGSKRGDRDLFEIIIYGWNETAHRPEERVVLLLDLGGSGTDALSMGQALRWTIENHLELDITKWVVAVSDNTNSMSGLGTGKKRKGGGAFFHVRRALAFKQLLPRFPCVLHVVHLAYTHARPLLMGATMPTQHDRETEHPWNFLWDIFKEFGLNGPDYRELKAELDRGFRLLLSLERFMFLTKA